MENEIQNFFAEIRVEDVHERFNNIESYQLDNTHKEGSKYIDSIVVSPGIIEYVEGYKLFEVKEITLTDYRVHTIDMNLEKYFTEQFCNQDKINHSMLDIRRKSHQNKFIKELEELLSTMQIEHHVDQVIKSNLINQ